MLKRILIVCISILILLGNINVFAEEYIEEELKEEVNQFVNDLLEKKN